jgi:spore coat protein U domain-containing protein, fimbrial subunit CupE1/2/3/6
LGKGWHSDRVGGVATTETESAMLGIDCKRTRLIIRTPVCTLSLFVITVIFVLTRPLTAGSASASLSVTATVLRTCSVSTRSFSIGNYVPSVRIAATDPMGNTELTVICKRGATSAITIGGGSNGPGVVVTSRVTFSDRDKLRYGAYKSSGQSRIWSDSASAVLYSRITNGTAPQSISVYSHLPHSQPVGGSSDVDTVTYIINF